MNWTLKWGMPGTPLAIGAITVATLGAIAAEKANLYGDPIRVPRLERAATIDGDISEWKRHAFTDGLWDIARLRQTPWYDAAINRLTDHGNEPDLQDDLAARYYIAWDDRFLYLAAEVKDNVNDIADPAHEPKRWYFKDAVCWFIEAPRTSTAKKFGEGDNAFCFVIDASKPTYGAWWRHGGRGKTYIEEPLPKDSVQYAIRMDPDKRGTGDFSLEARVAMATTLGASSPAWRPPRGGDVYGIEIVHTDPDGGGYGGHFLIYGRGDNDSTWGSMELTGPLQPVERKPE
jgi:cellulose/xylan binding protein with CBM9 domain